MASRSNENFQQIFILSLYVDLLSTNVPIIEKPNFATNTAHLVAGFYMMELSYQYSVQITTC